MNQEYAYHVISESLWHQDIGDYVSHGVVVASKYNFKKISDVSVDKEYVRMLVWLCNKNELDICQLRDVVEDFLVRSDRFIC